MPLKICFEDQTYKIATPDSYKALVQIINQIFANKLPQRWHLRYVDAEGDTITLSDKSDFGSLVEEQFTSTKIIKLIISPIDASKSNIMEEKKLENIENESLSSSHIIMIESQRQQQSSISQIPPFEEEVYTLSRDSQFKKSKKIVKKLANAGLSETDRDRLELKLCKLQKNFSPAEVRKLELKYLKLKAQQPQQEIARKAEMTQLITEVLIKQFQRLSTLPPLIDPLQNKEEAKPVHKGVSCNCCGEYPITGIRYKCSVCPSVDFCEKCEPSADHLHPLLKIKKPIEENKTGSTLTRTQDY